MINNPDLIGLIQDKQYKILVDALQDYNFPELFILEAQTALIINKYWAIRDCYLEMPLTLIDNTIERRGRGDDCGSYAGYGIGINKRATEGFISTQPHE